MIEKISVNSRDLATIFNVSVRTVWAWVAKGLPKSGRGQFPLLESIGWWRQNILGDIQGHTSLAEQKLRYAVARARREELIVQEREGELILKDLPLRWLRGQVEEAKMAFLDMPRRMSETLASVNDQKEIEHLLRLEVRRILTDLADRRAFLKGAKK